ncbi:LysR family transcriptional regulator [Pseudomonas sp. BN505]|uniref:LysR family transcriptional regulator n=1 Tax=unclassified Pseudomonas TaxID=196821 RepID=UPI002457470C|nr:MULTISPECIES: LysR family transcriptional regulator [unclassified Pseudomonas]MDH4842263.1 LysR family transcriptional regulator [Pseudomonas sp. BN605]MDH4855118.1 LysR family transcriptional regulator [Pseudomonas sp. BN505]
MNLRQLRALVEIHETGSLQDASQRMHVTQSALSKTIKEFESEMGVNLLVRSNKGVLLSEGGLRLLPHARLTLESVRRAQQDIEDFKGVVVSEINIGVTPVTAMFPALNEALIRFQTMHPQACLKVQEMRPANLLQRLRDGLLDFALTSQMPLTTIGLEWHSLGQLPSALIGRRNHPLRNSRSLRLLQYANWISADPLADSQSQLNQLFDGNGLPRPARMMECTALSLAFQQVSQTDALMITCRVNHQDPKAILPGLDIQEIQVNEPTPDYPINLVCPNSAYLTRSAAALFEMLRYPSH